MYFYSGISSKDHVRVMKATREDIMLSYYVCDEESTNYDLNSMTNSK